MTFRAYNRRNPWRPSLSYTLWSRGRLLGETDLGFVYRMRGFRCGWFHPTALGERVLPFATAVAPALGALRESGHDPTACADVAAAVDHEEALELTLRGPDDVTIPTLGIGIIDTHYLLSLADCELDDEDGTDLFGQSEVDATFDDWLEDLEPDEPWRPPEEWPRYQIQVNFDGTRPHPLN